MAVAAAPQRGAKGRAPMIGFMTARNCIARSIRVDYVCLHCGRWRELDLAALVEAGSGDEPLIGLPLRCAICARYGYKLSPVVRRMGLMSDVDGDNHQMTTHSFEGAMPPPLDHLTPARLARLSVANRATIRSGWMASRMTIQAQLTPAAIAASVTCRAVAGTMIWSGRGGYLCW